MADKNQEVGKKPAAAPKEGAIVKFSEKMWVEGTGASKHMPKGKKFEVTKVHGLRLIDMGAAAKTEAPE